MVKRTPPFSLSLCIYVCVCVYCFFNDDLVNVSLPEQTRYEVFGLSWVRISVCLLAVLIEFVDFLLLCSGKYWHTNIKLVHGRFVPNPFKSIMYMLSLYNVIVDFLNDKIKLTKKKTILYCVLFHLYFYPCEFNISVTYIRRLGCDAIVLTTLSGGKMREAAISLRQYLSCPYFASTFNQSCR
jgi:hypothetical protein